MNNVSHLTQLKDASSPTKRVHGPDSASLHLCPSDIPAHKVSSALPFSAAPRGGIEEALHVHVRHA